MASFNVEMATQGYEHQKVEIIGVILEAATIRHSVICIIVKEYQTDILTLQKNHMDSSLDKTFSYIYLIDTHDHSFIDSWF